MHQQSRCSSAFFHIAGQSVAQKFFDIDAASLELAAITIKLPYFGPFLDLVSSFAVNWHVACDHSINETAEWIVVTASRVILLVNFWCDELGRAHECSHLLKPRALSHAVVAVDLEVLHVALRFASASKRSALGTPHGSITITTGHQHKREGYQRNQSKHD